MQNDDQRPQNIRPAPSFLGEHLALDFLNTIAAPRGTSIEWLADGGDLKEWLSVSGAITSADVTQIDAFSKEAMDQTAQQAVELREWFRGSLFRVKAKGRSAFEPANIKRVNNVLERGAKFSVIGAQNDGFQISVRQHLTHPDQLLVSIATAIAALFCEADFELVRKCENPACTMWFYDRTKGHRRRWCSQAVCGNRAKAAAFRQRNRN